MTIPQYRCHEPLYLIIVRAREDQAKLAQWARKNANDRGLDGNRLYLHDWASFNKFQLSWDGDWSMTVIWDCWNKRHIENI